MSADAQPPVAPTVADQPRPASPKRLPGLWVICVILGLGAMFTSAMALSMAALGAAICCALAALPFALAVALWFRLRVGWWAAIVLLGIGFALGLVSGILAPRSTMWFGSVI